MDGHRCFAAASRQWHVLDVFLQSVSQKKKKQLHIMEITPEYLIIKLYSVSKLEMVSKSLAGFSRELLRVDEQRKARNEQSLFDNVEYNHLRKFIVGYQK